MSATLFRYFVSAVEQQQRCLIFIDYISSQHNFDNNLFFSNSVDSISNKIDSIAIGSPPLRFILCFRYQCVNYRAIHQVCSLVLRWATCFIFLVGLQKTFDNFVLV